MNLANLNQQELEQLQELLNKMNPSTQLIIDPVDQMIENIIKHFDFKRVQEVMDYLHWQWRGEFVTVEMLKQTARRLLRNAAEARLGEFKHEHWEQGIINSTGGFEATSFCNEGKNKIIALELKFVLGSWDEEIEN